MERSVTKSEGATDRENGQKLIILLHTINKDIWRQKKKTADRNKAKEAMWASLQFAFISSMFWNHHRLEEIKRVDWTSDSSLN